MQPLSFTFEVEHRLEGNMEPLFRGVEGVAQASQRTQGPRSQLSGSSLQGTPTTEVGR